jgi:flagella basal body P-ring formation protein FlgA
VVVGRFDGSKRQLTLDLAQIKRALADQGVNLLAIRFSGAASCKIDRQDDPSDALALARAQEQVKAMLSAPATRPSGSSIEPLSPTAPIAGAAVPAFSPGPFHSLRELLVQDVADRLALSPDALVVRFRPEDEKVLALSEPAWRFGVTARRTANIGDMTWDVELAGAFEVKHLSLTGNVRAWRTELHSARALGYHQVIKDEDVTEQRVLVDRLEDGRELTREQVIGSETARLIGPGEVITRSAVQAGQMIHIGQLVTVTLERPGVQIKWVAEARENGVYGQSINVRRPGTRDEFKVRITGQEQAVFLDGQPTALAER